jgi:hypothetical protein
MTAPAEALPDEEEAALAPAGAARAVEDKERGAQADDGGSSLPRTSIAASKITLPDSSNITRPCLSAAPMTASKTSPSSTSSLSSSASAADEDEDDANVDSEEEDEDGEPPTRASDAALLSSSQVSSPWQRLKCVRQQQQQRALKHGHVRVLGMCIRGIFGICGEAAEFFWLN